MSRAGLSKVRKIENYDDLKAAHSRSGDIGNTTNDTNTIKNVQRVISNSISIMIINKYDKINMVMRILNKY